MISSGWRKIVGKAVAKRAVGKRTRAKKSTSGIAPKLRDAKGKKFKRPNSLTLSDLLLWTTVVD
jgi:hypothetical protein